MSVTINVDTAALDRLIDGMVDGVAAAVRPAAQAAAQVLYDEVKRNVAQIGKVTGNLDRSIYQVYSKDHSIEGQRAVYHVSWNHKRAPHGHLLEYGHIQRYVVFMNKAGKWKTAVRPDKRGSAKPGRNASQGAKDAYYMPLPGGPRHVGARPFVRPAMAQFDIAVAAASERIVASIAVVPK